MKSKKLKIIIASLAVVLLAGGAATLAFLTDTTDLLTNVFQKGKKYTLTYHANTGSLIDDTKVNNLPEKQTEYGNKKDPVSFTVSSEVPTRPGMVFVKWTEGKAENTTVHEGGSPWEVPLKPYDYDLYAQWTAGYTLIYDANGGSGTPAITVAGDEKVNGNVVTTVTDANTYTFSKLATQGEMKGPEHKDSSDPEKTSTANRVFLGWSTDKGATEPEYTSDGRLAYDNTAGDYDGTKIDGFSKELEIKAAENPDKTVTLYAVWATKYELRFSYHPEMVKPKTGDPAKLEKPVTLVSASDKAPTFNLITQAEADANGYTPTREEGYRWGWWGDNLERFKFNKPGEGQSAAQAGNEGCYQFGEPVPARTLGDTSKAPNYDEPVLTLYAYFQPPSGCSLNFNDNTSNTRQFPVYADRNNTYKVTDMPDSKSASFTQVEWRPDIPDITPQHPRYLFLGWSEDMNSTNPEYQPGEKAYLNKILNNEVTLYAIWKPMHNFSLRFNINMPSESGRIHYKKEDGSWAYYTSSAGNNNNVYYRSYTDDEGVTKDNFLRKDPTVYFTDTSFTWSKEFFENEGLFATRADDSVGTYTFYGWSEEPVPVTTEVTADDADYPVVAPQIKTSANQSNQGLEPETPTGDQGLIKKAVTAEEGTPCTQPTTHQKVLYAVWRKSPKHQLRVVFDKGSADTLTYLGTNISNNDVHFIDIDGVRQNKDKYYASLDYPSYTWDSEYWKTHTPIATKEDKKDETATYTFLGWSTNEEHKTPSPTITKGDIDYPLDENNNIGKPITVNEKAADPKDCEGGIHEIKLYPVFRENPKHVYKLKYDVNAPSSADGIVTKLYSDLESTGSWKNVQVFPDPAAMDPQPDPMPEKGDAVGELYSAVEELSEKSWEWDMSGKGFFVTCDNTGSVPTGEYTFLGWTTGYKFKVGDFDPNDPTKKPDGTTDPSIKFYPVTAPDDPANPSGAGIFANDTKIKIDVDEQDPKPADACGEYEGKTHTETLYGVWAGEPIHQYSVIFAGNSSHPQENDVEILYGTGDDWTSGDENNLKTSKATVSKSYKRDDETINVKYYEASSDTEIELTKDIKNTYRVYSEALSLPKTPAADRTDSYTFGSSFWNDSSDPENVKDLIVKAKRNPSADTRYVFDGWNTKSDGTGTDITVDNKGYITSDLLVKDKGYGHTDDETEQYVIDCDSETHNIILYAKWKEVKIHNFQLIFYGYNANSLGYNDGTTWRSGGYVKNYKSPIDKNTITDITLPSDVPRYMYYVSQNVTDKYDTDGPDKKLSYSWGESGDSGEKLRVMAAKNKDDNYEYEFLGWSKDIKAPAESLTASDAEYHVDASGYIQEEEIQIDEPDTDCSKSTHTMVLYPVFKKIPIHNFSITMDLNGGSGLRKFNEGNSSWSNYSTYTFYKPEGTNSSTKIRTSKSDSSYTWGYDDFWSKNGFGAYKNYDNYYTYEFMGWSTVKKDISDNPDLTTNMVGWTKISTEYASNDSTHMTPLVNGFINDDVAVSCDNNPCTGGSHNVKLYAVWKRTPREKAYVLNFDANGGENAPDSMRETRAYDAANTSSWNSVGFTLTNKQITSSGMKNGRKVFVGWHENSSADQGRYGEKNTANTELEQLTQNLTNPYTVTNTAITTTLSSYTAEKTLYAIWWFEFFLEYDANTGSNAPEHEHAYTKDPNFPFEISKDTPTHSAGYKFLGWSEIQTTPGQGTDADVQIYPSTTDNKVDWNVTAVGDPSSDEYGYTGKKLYAVWGPAN